MNRRSLMKTLPVLAALRPAARASAPELQPITLPKPETDGGKPLMQALRLRRTTREIAPDKLPWQTVSNLLWAAFGVNRPEGPMGRPGRTAPSAMNLQEIEIYLALPEGVYRYAALTHRLDPVLASDIRAQAGRRPAVAAAPLTLIYVSDTGKFAKVQQPELQIAFTNADVGFIGQNVYLFCASEGLAAWFHTPDREALAKTLRLAPEQRVLYAQTVGYPAKK